MKVGILGTGDVGKSLGKAFLALGHEVKMGGRDPASEKAQAFAREGGPNASAGDFKDAATFGEIVVLCTLGLANEAVLQQAHANSFAGKLVIDTTNPLDFSNGFPPLLARPWAVSGGEQVQQILTDAKVVKAFNSVGNALMFKPELPGGPPTMFICGNDPGAKQQTTELLRDFGWDVLDVGQMHCAAYLEALCMIWVLTAAPTNSWMQAFKMLRK
jgi:predicted dinucleotide-binding enzyme